MTEETPAPEPEPTIEPGEGVSEEGNLVTRDLLYDEHTNKQFITVQTAGGNTFYIVIDYDKPVDEEGEQYETYFFSVVDEADLLAAAESAGVEQAVCSCSEKCAAGADNTECPVCADNKPASAGVEPEPLPPEGNLTIVDAIKGDAAGDKQFIYVQTKSGNTFYIIVDRAANGENTVYFLTAVDEADLMALMEDGEPAACSCMEKCAAGAVNTACPVCAVNMTECVGKEAKPEVPTEPTEPAAEEPEKKSGVGGILVVLLIVALGGGAAFYFFKQKKAKPQTKGSADLDDYDYGEDEDEYEFEPYEGEPEQDTTEDTDA